MKEKIFIDTGFWIALFDKMDEHHKFAKSLIKSILNDYHLCLSDFILFETITYLNCSAKKHELAIRFLNKIESINAISVFEVDNYIKNSALKIFKRYDDQFFSFTDCTSFIIIKEQGIMKYAGFDVHFRSMGYYPAV